MYGNITEMNPCVMATLTYVRKNVELRFTFSRLCITMVMSSGKKASPFDRV